MEGWVLVGRQRCHSISALTHSDVGTSPARSYCCATHTLTCLFRLHQACVVPHTLRVSPVFSIRATGQLSWPESIVVTRFCFSLPPRTHINVVRGTGSHHRAVRNPCCGGNKCVLTQHHVGGDHPWWWRSTQHTSLGGYQHGKCFHGSGQRMSSCGQYGGGERRSVWCGRVRCVWRVGGGRGRREELWRVAVLDEEEEEEEEEEEVGCGRSAGYFGGMRDRVIWAPGAVDEVDNRSIRARRTWLRVGVAHPLCSPCVTNLSV